MDLQINGVGRVRKEDLDVELSGAFIINYAMGTLTGVRTELERIFGSRLVYSTISRQNLYVVHWNDLSEKKQKELSPNK